MTVKVTYLSTFSLLQSKNQTLSYVKFPKYVSPLDLKLLLIYSVLVIISLSKKEKVKDLPNVRYHIVRRTLDVIVVKDC